MKKALIIMLVVLPLCSFGARKKTAAPTVQSMREFVDSLMSRMTLEEKIGQLNLQVAGDITTGSAQDTEVGGLIAEGKMGGIFNLKGVKEIRALQDIAVKQSRLGIPLIVGMDVIHGYETIFPIPLAMSCSWNLDAVENAARIAAREASADGISWVYSPMVDIALDARWGRVAEGNGEDPWLGSRMAEAYIRGYQGGDKSIMDASSVMACVKHFALYGAVEAGRDYNTVDMSHLRMYNQYFPPYRAAVEAGAGSIMSSFNLVDGQHATANPWLLTDVLRRQWNFDGFVVTDYGSIGEMVTHGLGDLAESSRLALAAGTDMDMCARGFLTTLTKEQEAQIDSACRRILEAKWRLGLFQDPYRHLDPNRRARDIYTDEHRAAAKELATESFVLLKNGRPTPSRQGGESALLPLSKESRIALIGPLGNDRKNIAGTWCVAYTPERYATVYEALQRAVKGKGSVTFAQGCNLTDDPALQEAAEFGKTIERGDAEAMRAEALRAAKDADVIVCAMGECADMSGESSSRADLTMPDAQHRLLTELVTLGKPVVLLHFSGRPTVLTWEQEHVDAIMNVWFGGSEAGDAIADVLFGDKAPCGRLTMTMPRATGQVPIYYNHLNTGRPVAEGATKYQKYASNYLDVRNDPLYPFGYGLTYTTFDYSPLTLSAAEMQPDGSVTASVTVRNTGSREGTEVVQLYIRDRVASVARPVKELKGFRRITLAPGAAETVQFTLTAKELTFFNGEGKEVLEPGVFDVMIGPNSSDVQAVGFSLTR